MARVQRAPGSRDGMSTLNVLLPPLAHVAADPAFCQWLAQGDRLSVVKGARTTALREWFRFAGATLPAAALRHHCHADDADRGAWLCADPVWIRSEATGARLMAWPLDDLSASEADDLAGALRPLFGDAGTPLAVDSPPAWCVHLFDDAPSATFTDPARALGVDLLECLPSGNGGRTWRRLFSEAQIALHAHPVNVARVAVGRQPVNGVWFWGAGSLPASVTTSLQLVASVDEVVWGLAKMGGALRVEPLPDALDAAGVPGDALLDLDIPGHATGAVAWLGHFRRWLAERRYAVVELTFAGGERFRLRHTHRLRFWRRP